MEFPLYRKYSNGKSIFKVHSEERMTEIQQIGKRHAVYELEAKIMPERFLIQDLINCAHDSIVAIEEADFEEIKLRILKDQKF